jgi:hypothetical protein
VSRHLLSALNPVAGWQEANLLYKGYYALKAPVDVLFKLTNPVVDREAPGHNWCQYQAVLQTLLGPTFAVFACAIALEEVGGLQVHRLGAGSNPI